MEYIRQFNEFTRRSAGVLDSYASNLYIRLFALANQNNWKDEWLSITNEWLMLEMKTTNHHVIDRAKNDLKEFGFIDFIPGGKHKPTQYKLIQLYQKYENGAQTGVETGVGTRVNPPQSEPQNSTEVGTRVQSRVQTRVDSPQKSPKNEPQNTIEVGTGVGTRVNPPQFPPTYIDNRHKTENKQQLQQPPSCAYSSDQRNSAPHREADVIPFETLQKEKESTPQERDAPPHWQEVVETYEQIHPISSLVERDKLIDLVDTYTAEWVIEAVKEAIYCNGRSARYVESILNRWQRDGFKSETGRSTGTYGTGTGKCGFGHGRLSTGAAKKTSRRIDPDSIDWSKEPDDWI